MTGDDGHRLVLLDYFNLAKRPDLTSHGATLSADLVTRLAGPDAPGQYAQAGAPAGAQVIGKVERVGGSATVQHANGVVEQLSVGDVVLKADVVMTNDGSSCTLSLIDGSTFSMGPSARMILGELLYNSSSTSNSALISLVKGSVTFVAGQVAHTGNMMVDTPVAVIGIRGTTVGAYCDADPSGVVYECTATLLNDPGGGSGRYEILDRVTGAVLNVVTSTTVQVNLTLGANNQVQAQEAPKSPAIVQQELAVAPLLYQTYLANPANAPSGQPQQQQQQPQQQQQTTPPGNSLTPPQDLPQPQQQTGAVDNSNQTTKVVEVPSVTAQPLAAILTTTTQTTNIPIVLIEATAPVENTAPSLHGLQVPGADQLGTLTSVATFGGSIDPAALLSAGWVPASDVPGSFQTNTLYGAALLDPNNRTLTYSLNPSNAAAEALQFGQTLQDIVVIPPALTRRLRSRSRSTAASIRLAQIWQ